MVVDLRLVVLGMQSGTEVDCCRQVAIEKAIVAGMEVFVPGQA